MSPIGEAKGSLRSLNHHHYSPPRNLVDLNQLQETPTKEEKSDTSPLTATDRQRDDGVTATEQRISAYQPSEKRCADNRQAEAIEELQVSSADDRTALLPSSNISDNTVS